jgi:outer membrane protein assembly factor BamD
MIRRLLLLLAFLTCLIAGACSRQRDLATMDAEDRMVVADDLKNEGRCLKAIAQYEQLLSEFPTQEIAERARFSLAECRVKIGEYDLARNDLEDFIDSYPRSDLVDNAMLLIAQSYMEEAPRPERDQNKTVSALDELYLLLREFPDSDVREEAEEKLALCRSKLAEKDYLSGFVYFRMGSHRAAHIYFDSVVEDFGETEWAARSLLVKGRMYSRVGMIDEAREAYRRVVDEHPDTRMSRDAAHRLKGLESESETGAPGANPPEAGALETNAGGTNAEEKEERTSSD